MVLNMIDQQSRFEQVTVLRSFCQSAQFGHETTISGTLQSIIFQAIQKDSAKFDVADEKLTKERFANSKDNIELLWALLIDVFKVAKTRCIWLVIDHIDLLEQSASKVDFASFVEYLSYLADAQDKVVKILITCRLGGKSSSHRTRKVNMLGSHHTILSVQRGQEIKPQPTPANTWATDSQQHSVRESPRSIDDLLASSSEESDKNDSHLAPPKVDTTDSDIGLESDDLDNPFASEPSDSDESNKGLSQRISISEDSVCGIDSMPISMTASMTIEGKRKSNHEQIAEHDFGSLGPETLRAQAPIHAWAYKDEPLPSSARSDVSYDAADDSEPVSKKLAKDKASPKQKYKTAKAGVDSDNDDSDYDFLSSD